MTMAMTTPRYDAVKVSRSTKDDLDRLKRTMNLSSYNQVISALATKQVTTAEVTEQVVKALADESAKVAANKLYEMVFALAKKVNKPISEITLADAFEAIKNLQ